MDSSADSVSVDGVIDEETICAKSDVTVPMNEGAESKIRLPEPANDQRHTDTGEEMASEAVEFELPLAAAMVRISQLEELIREKEARITSLASEKDEAVRLYEVTKDALEQLQHKRGLRAA